MVSFAISIVIINIITTLKPVEHVLELVCGHVCHALVCLHTLQLREKSYGLSSIWLKFWLTYGISYQIWGQFCDNLVQAPVKLLQCLLCQMNCSRSTSSCKTGLMMMMMMMIVIMIMVIHLLTMMMKAHLSALKGDLLACLQ